MAFNSQTISTHSFYSNQKRNLKGGNSASLSTHLYNRDDKRPSSSQPFRKKNFGSPYYDRRSSPKNYQHRKPSPYSRSPHRKYDQFPYGRVSNSAGNSRKRKFSTGLVSGRLWPDRHSLIASHCTTGKLFTDYPRYHRDGEFAFT